MPVRVLSTEEQAKVNLWKYDFCRQGKIDFGCSRDFLIFCLLSEAGLRAGEIAGLLYEDCYLMGTPKKIITIRGTSKTKNHERNIPVSSTLFCAFSKYYNAIFKNSTDREAPEFLFFSSRANHISVRQIERIVWSLCSFIGIARHHPHVFRHTFATNLMKVTDIRTVQELLGHKSITSTQIYTHPDSEDLRKAINSITPL